jgi:hypothetical protein
MVSRTRIVSDIRDILDRDDGEPKDMPKFEAAKVVTKEERMGGLSGEEIAELKAAQIEHAERGEDVTPEELAFFQQPKWKQGIETARYDPKNIEAAKRTKGAIKGTLSGLGQAAKIGVQKGIPLVVSGAKTVFGGVRELYRDEEGVPSFLGGGSGEASEKKEEPEEKDAVSDLLEEFYNSLTDLTTTSHEKVGDISKSGDDHGNLEDLYSPDALLKAADEEQNRTTPEELRVGGKDDFTDIASAFKDDLLKTSSSGWFNEPVNHGLAARGIKVRGRRGRR